MKNLVVAMASLAFLPAVSFAAAPSLSEVLDASGITLSGHASASYVYAPNQVQVYQPFGFEYVPAGAPGAFTGASTNSFSFNQANLFIAKLPAEGFGGALDLYAGQDASRLNQFGNKSDFNLNQAYVQYATGGLTVKGGKFSGLAGTEVVSDANNSNVTRSLLFSLQPISLTGVRASYQINNMITVYGGVSNSAQGFTRDNNSQKTIEASIALAPVTGLSMQLTNYYGNEGDSGDSSNLLDFKMAYALNALSLGLNGDYARNTDENMFDIPNYGSKTQKKGAALYANYQLTDALRVGLRTEYLKTDYTESTNYTNDKTEKEATLTGDYAFSKSFNLLAEVRYDKAEYDDKIVKVGGFLNSKGESKDSDTTLVVKAIYKF